MHSLRSLLWEEEGTTAVEYAVMLALVLAVCFVAIGLVGTNASKNFQTTAITTALGSGT